MRPIAPGNGGVIAALPPVLVTDWWSKNCIEISSRFPRRTPRSAHDASLQCGDRRQRIPGGGRSGFVERGLWRPVGNGPLPRRPAGFQRSRKAGVKNLCKPTGGGSRILRVPQKAMNRPSPLLKRLLGPNSGTSGRCRSRFTALNAVRRRSGYEIHPGPSEHRAILPDPSTCRRVRSWLPAVGRYQGFPT